MAQSFLRESNMSSKTLSTCCARDPCLSAIEVLIARMYQRCRITPLAARPWTPRQDDRPTNTLAPPVL
ncbi:hypothetical protein SNOG_03657 [Parastagonospora nodorum SN15]|uniref:Uncharacterized protein n=1 Tax=Phaeosphaeria nodorum (strain SN15 / ATCC MYA-4574 / FGSC 10173) TaxID=321614 RepID=Q0UX57_PHANO|nr:hypothetical protein SNOG_03657 [Parastagonospora nodorum SN15]EAT88862.1 hypothetical protein SNOG_03657 [Parastagonospora nodorum SN15]